jgi:quinol monooxygenase YgiN
MATTKTTPAPRQSVDPLLTVTLAKTKETPGTVRYDSTQEETDRIGRAINIYIPKSALPSTVPSSITLTVTPA